MQRGLAGWLFGIVALAGQAAADVPLRGWDNVGPTVGTQSTLVTDPKDGKHAAAWGTEGIYETLDSGATWRLAALPCVPYDVSLRPNSIYATCYSGIFRSANHGDTWEAFYPSDVNSLGASLALHPRQTGFAVARTYDLVKGGYVVAATRDDGRSWTRPALWTPPSTSTSTYESYAPSVAFDPFNDTRVLGIRNVMDTSGSTMTSRVELVSSTFDTLGSWTTVGTIWSTGPNTLGCGGYDVAIDGNGIIYVGAACGIAVSRDGGRSWEQFTRAQLGGPDYPDYGKAVASPVGPSRAAVSIYPATYFTEDAGRSWRSVGAAGRFTSTAIGGDGALWTSEYDGRVYRIDNGVKAATSLARRSARPTTVEVAGLHSEVLLAALQSGGMLRSADGGNTWTELGGDAAAISFARAVPGQPLAVYGGTGYFAGIYESLWFSSDAGQSWRKVATPPLDGGLMSLSPVGPQPGVIYATTSRPAPGGFIGPSPPIPVAAARSDDGGRTWRSIQNGIGGENPIASASAGDVDTVYVTTTLGVHRSRDGGNTWKLVWDATARGALPAPVVDARNPSLVYALAAEKIWTSEDGGDTWREGLAPNSWSNASAALFVHPGDSGRVFVVSADAAVFESSDRARTWTRSTVAANSDTALTYPRLAVDSGSVAVVAKANNTIVARNVTAAHPRALGTDLWWNPAQPGWGLSIVQHENFQVFAVWFTYDAQGKPTWRFVSGGTWTDPNTFSGVLAKAQSAPGNYFTSTFQPALVDVRAVGAATLRFADDNTGEATFQLDGTTVRLPLKRMGFGPVAARKSSMADLWWNGNESGWGISMHQQYSTVFATWFLYDDQGAPTWLLMPAASIGPAAGGPAVSGDVYRASAAPGAAYAARNVVVNRVGTATVGASIEFTVDGISGTRGFVSRLPF